MRVKENNLLFQLADSDALNGEYPSKDNNRGKKKVLLFLQLADSTPPMFYLYITLTPSGLTQSQFSYATRLGDRNQNTGKRKKAKTPFVIRVHLFYFC